MTHRPIRALPLLGLSFIACADPAPDLAETGAAATAAVPCASEVYLGAPSTAVDKLCATPGVTCTRSTKALYSRVEADLSGTTRECREIVADVAQSKVVAIRARYRQGSATRYSALASSYGPGYRDLDGRAVWPLAGGAVAQLSASGARLHLLDLPAQVQAGLLTSAQAARRARPLPISSAVAAFAGIDLASLSATKAQFWKERLSASLVLDELPGVTAAQLGAKTPMDLAVHNRGTTTRSVSSATIYLRAQGTTTSISVPVQLGLRIGAGKTAEITFPIDLTKATLAAGTYDAELSFAGARYPFVAHVLPRAPDLAVRSVSAGPLSASTGNVTLDVTVANEGTTTTYKAATLAVAAPGEPLQRFSFAAGLAAKGTRTVKLDLPVRAVLGAGEREIDVRVISVEDPRADNDEGDGVVVVPASPENEGVVMGRPGAPGGPIDVPDPGADPEPDPPPMFLVRITVEQLESLEESELIQDEIYMFLTGMHSLAPTRDEHETADENDLAEGDHRWIGHTTFNGWREVSRTGLISGLEIAMIEDDRGLGATIDPDDEIDYAYLLVHYGLARQIHERHNGVLRVFDRFSGDGGRYETRTRIEVMAGGVEPEVQGVLQPAGRPVNEWNGAYVLYAGPNAGAGLPLGDLKIHGADACAAQHLAGASGPAFEAQCPIFAVDRHLAGNRLELTLLGHGALAPYSGRYSGYLIISADEGYSFAGTVTFASGMTTGFRLLKGWN